MIGVPVDDVIAVNEQCNQRVASILKKQSLIFPVSNTTSSDFINWIKNAIPASASGTSGESQILTTRDSARPLRKYNRVADACASTCPPIGFFGSLANDRVAPGSAVIYVSYEDLVGDIHCDIEFFGDTCQFREHLSELLLAFGELAAAWEVGAEEGHDGVDDDETVLFVFTETDTELIQELELVLGIVCSLVRWVVEYLA